MFDQCSLETRSQIHLCTSYLYTKLKAKEDVKRWNRDILEKKLVLIPINEDLHWSLVVIFKPNDMVRKYTIFQR